MQFSYIKSTFLPTSLRALYLWYSNSVAKIVKKMRKAQQSEGYQSFCRDFISSGLCRVQKKRMPNPLAGHPNLPMWQSHSGVVSLAIFICYLDETLLLSLVHLALVCIDDLTLLCNDHNHEAVVAIAQSPSAADPVVWVA